MIKICHLRRTTLNGVKAITQVAHAVTADPQLGFSFKTFFFEWNVFFALLFGFIDLCILTSEKKWIVKIAGVLATMILSYLTNTEWWIFGQLIIIAYYFLRKHALLYAIFRDRRRPAVLLL